MSASVVYIISVDVMDFSTAVNFYEQYTGAGIETERVHRA